jgi:8-oxo-dGTP pyrophosphatase MutT (NUDIX family)
VPRFPYRNTPDIAHHLSVGAVVVNDRHQVLTLRRQSREIILPTGTLNPRETLLDALHRELLEETGAEAKLVRYLGSTEMPFTWNGLRYNKTVLWHHMQLRTTVKPHP